ncbi:MAG: UDP-N-acetylmuramate--L-alanine ligase [bacterium]
MFKDVNNIHFIGIGGIGMSGIAAVLNSMGYNISGSDIRESAITRRLEDAGIRISYSHDGRNIEKADIVVFSSAVHEDNPEIEEARRNNIPVIARAEMLAEIMRLKTSIAVSGTHGKTTTTSMTASIIETAGMDPTVIVGGIVKSLKNNNAQLGSGDYIVAEADESDKSFIKLLPDIAVITNIDIDHLDNYNGIDEIKEHFGHFIETVPFEGLIIYCSDDKNASDTVKGIDRRAVGYGFNRKAQVRASGIELTPLGSSYELSIDNQHLGKIQLNVPGQHNILNSLAAVSVGFELGIEFETVRKALGGFEGVCRRFDVIFKNNARGIFIVDDYAHHPKEIISVLNSARNMGDYRIVTVFQPHLYSRTLKLMDKFAEILSTSDITVITDIYPAREKPMENVTGETLFDQTVKYKGSNIYYIENKDELPGFLKDFAEDNTIFLFMGAGDINKYSRLLKEELSNEN